LSPNAAGELLATGDPCDEREKAYAVASQLDWVVRRGYAFKGSGGCRNSKLLADTRYGEIRYLAMAWYRGAMLGHRILPN